MESHDPVNRRNSPCAAAVLGAGVLALLCGAAGAADEVVTVDGEVHRGECRISGGSLGIEAATVKLVDLVSVRFAEGARFSSINQGVLTTGGDLISGTVSELKDGVITVVSELFGTVKIKRDEVRLVSLRPSSIVKLTTFDSEFEGVLLSNDDRARGGITWMSAEMIGVKTRSGIFQIPRKRASIISFGAKGAAGTGSARLFLRLTNGDLLAVESPELGGGKLSFKSSFGQKLSVDRKLLYELYRAGGRVVHLSGVRPSRAEHIPQFDASFPHRVDSSVGGSMLRVGKRTYQRGIGVHSKSVLEYDLGGKYSRLLAEIGVDEEVSDRGSVAFVVRVDGREVFSSGTVTGRMGPQRIKADLGGGKKLTLEVGFGPDGADAGDHADWCMPVLIAR